MTRAPQVKLRDCNSPFPSTPLFPLRLLPRLVRLIEIPIQIRASDSGTRSIILDMTFPLPPPSLFALVPPRNHPPVTPRPVGQYAAEVMWCRLYTLPRPLLTTRRALTGKMLSSRVSQLFRTYFLPFFRSVCFCLYKVTLIENLISRIVPLPRQANDIFKKFPISSRFFNQA